VITIETLPHQIRTGDIDTVVVAFPDLQGRPVGKRVTGPFFLDHVAEHGIEACDYLLAVDVDMTPLPGYEVAGWEHGYGDLHAAIDPGTVRPLPWTPGTALVLCDLFDADGRPVAVSPRQVLRRQIERAAEHGLTVSCATELEFYLFRHSFADAADSRWRDMLGPGDTIQDYQLLQTSRDEDVLGQIRAQMLAAGIPVESSKGEAGPGQHEVNLTYGNPLEVADRHMIFKDGVKEIAAQHGRSATFMAKWSMEHAGSSCHIHTSLRDATTGRALMAPDDGDGSSDGSGFSEIGRRFVAGQVHSAAQLAWCFAPYLNSYRRYLPNSWAPTALAWGTDNRTCGFRAVGSGEGRRIENRVPGADVNPYLALAASIAGGLWGIDHGLELEPAFGGNAYVDADLPRIPSTLVDAIDLLARSEVASEAFGADVHHHMVNTARQEWASANQVVTEWELARNFERI
jgi:glutamine synthetase